MNEGRRQAANMRRHRAILVALLSLLVFAALPAQATRTLPSFADSLRTRAPLELSRHSEAASRASEKTFALFDEEDLSLFAASSSLDRAGSRPFAAENRIRLFADSGEIGSPAKRLWGQKTAVRASMSDWEANIRARRDLAQIHVDLFFQGAWTDPLTGIAYHRNRWYDPRTASWLSEDPSGAVDSPNLYAFVGWSPQVGTDPLGLQCACGCGEGSPPCPNEPQVLFPFIGESTASSNGVTLVSTGTQEIQPIPLRQETIGPPRRRVEWMGAAEPETEFGEVGDALYAGGAYVSDPSNYANTALLLFNAQEDVIYGHNPNDDVYLPQVFELRSQRQKEWTAGLMIGSVVLAGKPRGGPKPRIVFELKANRFRDVSTGQWTRALATDTNKAFFWSGRTRGIGGEAVARKVATAKGAVTLEKLIEERGISMPAWDPTNPASLQAWAEASRQYAAGASGEVRAVVGESLRPGNVWENIELPELIKNKNVTKITTIDPATGAEKVVFSR